MAMVPVKVYNDSVMDFRADVLVLKHADGYHGIDAAVAKTIGFGDALRKGDWRIVPSANLQTPRVLFIGVGPLYDFRYESIREFATTALTIIAKELPEARMVALTMHGVNYGLDAIESFSCLIAGVYDFLRTGGIHTLDEIAVVERNERVAKRIGEQLQSLQTSKRPTIPKSVPSGRSGEDRTMGGPIQDERGQEGPATRGVEPTRSEGTELPGREGEKTTTVFLSHTSQPKDLDSFGPDSEKKPTLFVAMPFRDEYIDEFEIGILEAAKNSNLLVERLDLESYVGDVLAEIKRRIDRSSGVIALLNGSNANVHLEVGYAWGKDRPTILIIRRGEDPCFDVRGQKRLEYSNIVELRKVLTSELASLKQRRVLN